MRSRSSLLASPLASRVALRALGALVLLLLLAGTAAAQDDEAADATRLQGIAYAGYTHSYQSSNLPEGPPLDDANGVDAHAGFQAGDYLAFLLGIQWQRQDDFDTYFVPLTVRAMSPPLLERIRLYGQFGFGLFFSRLRGELTDNDDERASAFSAGGGIELGLTKSVSGLLYGAYQKGLGAADDYKSAVVGVGLQYRWDL